MFVKCTACGKDVLSTAKFCTFCGAKVEAPAPAPAAPAGNKFCTGCGSPIAPGAKFCTVCGTKVPVPAAVVEEVVETAAAPVTETMPEVEETAEVAEAVVEETAEVAEAVVEETTEVAEAVVEETAEVAEAVVEETAEVAEAVVEETAEVAEAVVEETAEVAEAVAEETAGVAEAAVEETAEVAETALEEAAVLAGLPEGTELVSEEVVTEAVQKSKKRVLPTVLAVLAILGLIAGNVVMFLRGKNATEFYEGYIRNLNNEKSEILAQLSEYDEQISEYDAIIADTADELQLYYDILQDDSNNHIQEFHTSTPLVVLSLSEGDVGHFLLTATYDADITVTRDEQGSSAYTEWGSGWYGDSLDIYVYPVELGVTTVTYTNNINADSVTVTVVVVE